MDRCVERFVHPITDEKLESYHVMAANAGSVWMKQCTLEYVNASPRA